MLKIKSLDSMNRLMIALHDVKDWQLEGIRYRVTEEENDAFSFNCEQYELI